MKTYGVVTPDILQSYDGLSFLKAIIAGELPNPPISELMGFHLAEGKLYAHATTTCMIFPGKR